MCRLDSRKVEILKAALQHRRFYQIYKSTSVPLATTWRLVKKLAEEKFLTYTNGEVEITEKGLIVLSYNGDARAAALLALKYNVSTDLIIDFINILCENYNILTMPFSKLYDYIVLIDFSVLEKFKGSKIEPLLVKLLFYKYSDLAWEIPGGRYLISKDGVVAAQCSLCSSETRWELFPQCVIQNFFKTLKMQFLKSAVEFSDELRKT
ncbi:MAG: hypothetical protein QXR18_03555 [Pyrobaculum sp.]